MAYKYKPATREKVPQVALLVETSLSPGRDILKGIGQYLRENGPWNLCAYPHDVDQPPPPWFAHWQGDGIIARMQNRRIVNAAASKGVPAVDVLGVCRQKQFPLVHVNNAAIAQIAAHHLLEQGLRHFGYFGLADEYWSIERQRAFVEYLRAKDQPCECLTFSRGQLDRTPWQIIMKRTAQWLRRLPGPVGILLCSDAQGLLVMEACKQVGLRIGETVSLLGINNDITLCEMSTPSLSSVEANHVEVGYRAAQQLDELMRGRPRPRAPLLIDPVQVVVRESTGFLSAGDPTIASAVHFIRHHLHEPIGIDDVAGEVGLSRSTIQRRFRQILGRTVHDQLASERLRRAIELLGQTALSIEQVAQRAGYGYAQNMGKIFRQRLGKSPKELRKGYHGRVKTR